MSYAKKCSAYSADTACSLSIRASDGVLTSLTSSPLPFSMDWARELLPFLTIESSGTGVDSLEDFLDSIGADSCLCGDGSLTSFSTGTSAIVSGPGVVSLAGVPSLSALSGLASFDEVFFSELSLSWELSFDDAFFPETSPFVWFSAWKQN